LKASWLIVVLVMATRRPDLMRARPRRSADSGLIRRLDAEWQALAPSRLVRDRLQAWGAEDHRLAFDDGDQLLKAAQRRDVSSWAERDQVLAALLERASDDALARRVALQVVLPGLKSSVARPAESPTATWLFGI
jgi:hypothetical protein